jgi:acyl-CoA thioester hydrolase
LPKGARYAYGASGKETSPVNAPTLRDRPLRLDDLPFRITDNIRFADLDPNQHVNNTAYAIYFETARVALIRDPARRLMPPDASWVLVRLDINFRAELHWPGRVDLGLGIARLGRSSVTFSQGVFSAAGVCAATAIATTVLVDRASRKPVALTPLLIDGLNRFALPPAP